MSEDELTTLLKVNNETKMNEYIMYKLYGYGKLNEDKFSYLKYGELLANDKNVTNATYKDVIDHY